jgi:hypothetical protein
VFDEAQRAFSPEMVADKHMQWKLNMIASEPELFIQVCDRMPEWSVLVGLIGGGQEIHLGEEEGLIQWRDALESSPQDWTIHAPENLAAVFCGSHLKVQWNPSLSLDTEIRFHSATELHKYVGQLLSVDNSVEPIKVAESLAAPYGCPTDGMKLYITRTLDCAKNYLHTRYAEAPRARFGILASSRDRDLPGFGIQNDYMSTKNVPIGPWFTEDEPDERSCRHLEKTVTEFGCQGLELDMAIVAWGTDLIREKGKWTIRKARHYRQTGRTAVRDPFQMRLNAYRVLLTRGRDGVIIFVPPLKELDETWSFLMEAGFMLLE